MAGYSRLIDRDETDTPVALKVRRRPPATGRFDLVFVPRSNDRLWAGQRRSHYSPKLTSETVGQGCDENGDRLEACWDDSAFR